jgi:hypothetical protein
VLGGGIARASQLSCPQPAKCSAPASKPRS